MVVRRARRGSTTTRANLTTAITHGPHRSASAVPAGMNAPHTPSFQLQALRRHHRAQEPRHRQDGRQESEAFDRPQDHELPRSRAKPPSALETARMRARQACFCESRGSTQRRPRCPQSCRELDERKQEARFDERHAERLAQIPAARVEACRLGLRRICPRRCDERSRRPRAVACEHSRDSFTLAFGRAVVDRRSLRTVRCPVSCADILAGRAPADAPVTVNGWVRTRRDSKAGLSFVHVSDGSGFHPVQVVAPETLPNYASEVMHLTAGCAVEATGKIVPSPAKGQPFEMQADAVRVVGWVDDPGHVSDPAQAAHARVPARGRAPAAAHERDRRAHARAAHDRARRSTASSTSTASCGSTRRSSRPPMRKARARCSASRRSILRTCRARRKARSTSRRTSSGARPSSPCPGSSTSRPIASRCPRSTRSAPRSAPRTPTRAGTWPSSG